MQTSFAFTYVTALVATFGLLAVFAMLLKRFGQPWMNTGQSTRRMKVVERLPLAPNTTAYLIEIDGTTLLAITTPQSSLVHSWDAAEPATSPAPQPRKANKGKTK